MPVYEISVSLRAKDYFYTENKAESSAAGRYTSFSEAFFAYCEAIAFGYSINTEKLAQQLREYNKMPEQVDISCKLSLIRREGFSDSVLLENERSDSAYEGESNIVACGSLSEEENNVLSQHGIELEEDSFGSYFEIYPLNDLLYDLSDSADGLLDPTRTDLKELVKEYTHTHRLLTNEMDPAEDGYFCPGADTKESCFNEYGKLYGYSAEERIIFTDALVKYPHGYVLELRD